MVNPEERITKLAGTTFGPVAYEAGDDGLVATFDGETAQVQADHGALCISARALVDAEDVAASERAVRAALADVALGRSELCAIGWEERHTVASIWVDAGASGAELAMAVRTSILLARLGAEVAGRVVHDAVRQARLDEARAEAERLAAVADQSLQATLTRISLATAPTQPPPVPEAPPVPPTSPAAPPPPAPNAPSTPAAAAPSPPAPAPAAVRHGRWCVADAPTEVRDLRHTDRVVGALAVNTTYEVRREADGWLHVHGHGTDGWVQAAAVRQWET